MRLKSSLRVITAILSVLFLLGFSVSLFATASAEQLLPDLTTNSYTIPLSPITAGDKIDILVSVRNIGNANTDSDSKLMLYLNPGSLCLYENSTLPNVGETIPQLNAGQASNDITLSLSTQSTLSSGTYSFGYFIDRYNDVTESNEFNNKNCFQIKIKAQPSDLIVSSATIINTNKLYTGDVLEVDALIQNFGNSETNNVNYSLALYGGDNKEYQLENLNPSTLGNLGKGYGQYRRLKGSIPLSCLLPYVGTYKVKISLDANNAEPNKTNNSTSTSNLVQIERYNLNCGPNPPPPSTPPVVLDYDLDGFKDVEEKKAGTNILAINKYQLKDANYSKAITIKSDLTQKVKGGDPVNLRTGALELTQDDFTLSGRGLPLNLTRIYNSKLADWNGRFGYGWNFSFNNFYYQDPTDKSVQIYLNGNLSSQFTTTDNGVTYLPARGEYDSLINESNVLVYKTLEGIKYHFSKKLTDNMSLIQKITDTNNNTTNFTYTSVRDVPLLTTITDSSGRAITLTYGDSTSNIWDKVTAISENLTGSSRYIATTTYDNSGHLTNVRYFRYYNGNTETMDYAYTYDISHRLLTFTDPRGTILYNSYDSSDRIIAQYEYNSRIDSPGTNRRIFAIAYTTGFDLEAPSSTHCTVLTSYRDDSASYNIKMCFNSDELKIFEKDGQGNIQRWSYNSQGMVSQYTDQNGAITKYEYDAKRRLIKETLSNVAAYKTEIAYEYENNFNRLIKKTVTATPIGTGSSQVKIFTYNIDSANGNVTSTIDALGYQESFTYDSYGNVTQYTDKNNNSTNYAYDANGNYRTQESITATQADNTIQSIVKKYTYDAYGNKQTYTTPRNNSYQYTYDSKSNLRQETNPQNYSRTYTYDLENHRLTETNESGKVTNFTYDTDINASLLKVEKVSAFGNIVNSRQYDYLGNVVDETDPLGRQTTYTYNSANRISQKSTPLNTLTYTYYPNGKLKTGTNSLNQKTEYYYDSRGQLTETRRYTDTTSYISIKTNYDGFGRVISTIDANGNTTTFTYDLNDKLTSKTDALGNITTYTYDKSGNKTGELLPNAQTDSTLRNSQGHTTSYQYDEANRLIKTINAQNKQTLRYYDGNNNLIKLVDRQNSDGTYSYHTTQYTYDALNRLTKETDPYNAVVSSTYDKVGNLLTKTDQMGRTITYTYDDFNRLISETDPANNITKYTYDKVGNRLSITYPDNKTTNYTYNQINKLLTVTDTLNNVRTFTYDVLGNKLTEKDKRGYTTSFQYDNLSRLTQETNPQNIVSTYTYDNNGNRLSETVNNSRVTSYQYDKLNRITKITRPGDVIESFTYDGNGNIKTKINGNNQTITHTYDSLDRLTNKQLPTGETNVSYTYDNWNNLTQIIDESGTTAYVYNYNNQPTSETKTLSGLSTNSVITRTYNSANQLNVLTDPANRAITYTYNNRGLLDKATYNTQDLAKYTYNSNNKVQTITYGNGVTTNYTYDDLQRATKIETLNSSLSVLSKQEYTYDAESNRLSLVENNVRTTTYNYDSLDQLATIDYSNVSYSTSTYDLTYTYDSFGNRKASIGPVDSMSYSYANNNTNELTNYSYNSGKLSVDLQYDGNGSLTKETYTRLGILDKNINYSWNSQNKLKQVQYTYNNANSLIVLPTNTLKFTYDDSGNRIMKVTAIGHQTLETTYYLNDGLAVLNELDSNGNVNKSIIRGLGQIAEVNASGTIKYIHQDILGSTILITDVNGNINQEYEYDPFGQMIGGLMNTDNNQNTKYLYTGQEFDAESELYYYNARYYNPVMGRFVSLDPILGRDGNSLTRNGYVYVLNNPLKYVDESGEEETLAGSGNSWLDNIGKSAGEIWNGLSNFAFEAGAGFSEALYNTAGVFENAGDVAWHYGEDDPNILTSAPKQLVAKPAAICTTLVSHFYLGAAEAFDPYAKWETRTWNAAMTALAFIPIGKGVGAAKGAVATVEKGTAAIVGKQTIGMKGEIIEQGVKKMLPIQEHHVISPKSSKWSSTLDDIVRKYNPDLEGKWNKVNVPQLGRHPDLYHEYIGGQLIQIDEVAMGSKSVFMEEFNKLKTVVESNPEMLRKLFW